MATFSQKDVQKLFVGGLAGDTSAALAAMPAGEIGIFTPGGTRITEASAATTNRFMIVQSRGAGVPALYSGVIDKTKVAFTANARLHTAATQQVDVIGFNGTNGAIEAINDNLYMVDLSLGQSLVSNHGGLYLKHGVYKSDLNATQAEVASGIAKSLITNFSREPERIITVETLCDDAGAATAIGAAADTVVGNAGSRFVTIVDTAADASVNPIAPGDYFRAGTAVTDPVYLVVASTVGVNGGVLELSTPLQAAVNLVGTTAEFITAVLAAAADFGVRITGVQQPFNVGKLHDNANSWKLTLKDFGNTLITNVSNATVGTGTERQVSELEWFCQGNEGDYFRMGEPYIEPIRGEATGTYDLIQITTSELTRNSIVSGPINQQLTLAIPTATPAYADGGTANDITDVLEVLIYGATNGNLAV